MDNNGGIYVAGGTTSTQATLPNGAGLAATAVPGFDQTYNGGIGDALVVKLGPTATLPPTITPTAAATPTASPTATLAPILGVIATTTPFACGPRPTIGISVVPIGNGRLQVTVSPSSLPATPGNHLTQLRAAIPDNARIDVLNGPQNLAGDVGVPIGDGTQPVVFFVRRIAPGPIHVPLTLGDTCGLWPSFVGGGQDAF